MYLWHTTNRKYTWRTFEWYTFKLCGIIVARERTSQRFAIWAGLKVRRGFESHFRRFCFHSFLLTFKFETSPRRWEILAFPRISRRWFRCYEVRRLTFYSYLFRNQTKKEICWCLTYLEYRPLNFNGHSKMRFVQGLVNPMTINTCAQMFQNKKFSSKKHKKHTCTPQKWLSEKSVFVAT